MATKIVMPEMGEGVIEGTIVQWLKKEGDVVKQYEPILEIETDKVTTEATAEMGGVLLKIVVPQGAVAVGTLLGYIGKPGEALEENGAGASAPVSTPASAPSRGSANGSPASHHAITHSDEIYTGRVSPVVARMAAEHGLDLNQIQGRGLNGRITKKDIQDYLERREASPVVVKTEPVAVPTVTQPVAQPVAQPMVQAPTPQAVSQPSTTPMVAGEIMPLSNMRRAIAEHMVRSKHTSPHVTTVFEFDFTAVAKHREANKNQFARDGVNLTFTAYIVAATAMALKKHPLVNSSWGDNGILLHKAVNIGMAAAIEEGLIVPVIKNADGLNLLGLGRTINDLTQRARQKQLLPGDVQGGTFTITNHGTSGSLFATPIINQPQCGILGTGKIEKRVKVVNDAIAIRPMAYVSLTFDHRILDGASADGFVSTLKELIENW